MNIIIAGSRDFTDYHKLKRLCDAFIGDLDTEESITIISGGSKGADRLGELYAAEKGYDLKIYPADWEKYDKAAGPIRNSEMVKIAQVAIVIWDGKSRGSLNMVSEANRRGLKLYQHIYENTG